MQFSFVPFARVQSESLLECSVSQLAETCSDQQRLAVAIEDWQRHAVTSEDW